MATFLDLPREIYLIVCSLLSTKDLVTLASLCRQHYLAVQRPLYSKVHITSYGALIKLVGALTRPPVIAPIHASATSWLKFDDIQIDERQIEHLNLTMNVLQDRKITASILAHCIRAIGRNRKRLKIALKLVDTPPEFIRDLESAELPGVYDLAVFILYGGLRLDEEIDGREGSTSRPFYPVAPLSDRTGWTLPSIWNVAFSAISFPDVRKVYISSTAIPSSRLPSSLAASLTMEMRARRLGMNPSDGGTYKYFPTPHALVVMEELTFENNDLLNSRILESLFASKIVPERLTKLRIVNCPSLHPIIEMATIAKLLHRSLPLVKFLTLHLTPHDDGHYGYAIAYRSKISNTPEHHICNIVRELGRKVQGLDLLLPFACHHMFPPPVAENSRTGQSRELEIPSISPKPACTLPDRLIACGYRYRRIIFNEFCCDANDWDDMTSRARDQGNDISWELLYNLTLSKRAKGVWLVSDCLPVELNVQEVLQRPFDE